MLEGEGGGDRYELGAKIKDNNICGGSLSGLMGRLVEWRRQRKR
jgi:hypothetical protein